MAAWSGLCFCSRVYLRPCGFGEEKLLFSLVKVCPRPRVPTHQALARPLLIGGQEEGEDSLSLTFRSHPGQRGAQSGVAASMDRGGLTPAG